MVQGHDGIWRHRAESGLVTERDKHRDGHEVDEETRKHRLWLKKEVTTKHFIKLLDILDEHEVSRLQLLN